MRNIKSLCVIAVVFAFTTAPASALLSDVTFFDFTGWDADLVQGAGQLFTDICPEDPELTVFVEGVGDFTKDSKYAGGFIRSGHLSPNDTNTFRFTFNKSLSDLVVMTTTVDSQENFDIIGVGPEVYSNISGAVPMVTPIGASGIELEGMGVGQDPVSGASKGYTTSMAQAGLAVILRHSSLTRPNKFEAFAIGAVKPIPEPSAYTLLALSLVGMLSLRRRG